MLTIRHLFSGRLNLLAVLVLVLPLAACSDDPGGEPANPLAPTSAASAAATAPPAANPAAATPANAATVSDTTGLTSAVRTAATMDASECQVRTSWGGKIKGDGSDVDFIEHRMQGPGGTANTTLHGYCQRSYTYEIGAGGSWSGWTWSSGGGGNAPATEGYCATTPTQPDGGSGTVCSFSSASWTKLPYPNTRHSDRVRRRTFTSTADSVQVSAVYSINNWPRYRTKSYYFTPGQ